MIKLHWRRVRSRYPWLHMIQTWRFWLLVLCTVVLLTYVIVSFRKKPVMYLEQEIKEIWLGNIEFDFQTGLYFLKDKDTVFLRGSMPDSHQLTGHPNHCGVYNLSKYLCASWYPKMKLEVSNVVEEHATCQVLKWTSQSEAHNPHTCFSLADFNWYGGSLLRTQKWPLNKADIPLQPYVTHDLKSFEGKTNTFGSIVDWFWISSSGVAIIVDNANPIHVSVNQSGDNLMCFYSKTVSNPVLKYSICKADNLRKIHHYVLSKYVHLPLRLPKDVYFSEPMWSTSAVYKNGLDQAKLLKFGQDIHDNGFSTNVLDIQSDGISMFRLGDFDKNVFPNSHQSFMILRELKFELFLPISPFVSVDGKFDKVKYLSDVGGRPLIDNFQGASVNVIDLLDTETMEWYVNRVKFLMVEYGFNGVHLLSGESDLTDLPNLGLNAVDMETFYEHYSSMMLKKLNTTSLTSFAYKSQSSAHVVLLPSQASSWGMDGLQGIIPSVLTLGMLGYPFVIPDTIGGPGSVVTVNSTYSEHVKPDRELYIRWLGLSAYMPCMMFSYPPWLYDVETVEISKQFAEQHKNKVSHLVIKAAREFEHTGSPIIRPLWWIDPHDSITQLIDDQYLIGDSMMVAPILHAGKTARDIYIPQGRWLDNINDKKVEPKTWLRNFNVPLEQVAVFTIIKTGV
ncbi:hypothetical protein ACF0H5_006216 [Mactra antiquata]